MGCGNEVNKEDFEKIEEASQGKHTVLSPEIEEKIREAQNHKIEAVNEVAKEVLSKGEKLSHDWEAINKVKLSLGPMSDSLAKMVVDRDSEISVVPKTKEEVPQEKVEEMKEIWKNLPDDAIIHRERNDFLDSPVKGKGTDENYPDNIPEAVVFDVPYLSKGSLKAMAQKKVGTKPNTKAPRGIDGKPMEQHHWQRQNEGPFLWMNYGTHRKHFGELHKFEPPEQQQVDHGGTFAQQKDQLYEFALRQHLGEWTDDFIEMIKEENNQSKKGE